MSDEIDDEFLSVLYHALRTQRRRQVIRILVESDGESKTVRSLARRITAIEHDVPRSQATGEPYRNVYNALSQTHLPTLVDANVVIYDPKRQTVSSGSNLQIAALLVITNSHTINILSDYFYTQ